MRGCTFASLLGVAFTARKKKLPQKSCDKHPTLLLGKYVVQGVRIHLHILSRSFWPCRMNAERTHFPSPCSSRTTAEPDANSNASPHNSHGHRASQDEHHLHVLLPALFDVRSVVAIDVHTLAVSTPPEAQSGDPEVRCAARNSWTAGELLLEQLRVHPSDSAPRREEQRTREAEEVMNSPIACSYI